MAKIAIDIALLPSAEMQNRAIDINRELLKTSEDKIILDKEKCLPHITLCMGCIEEDEITGIKAVLDEIAHEFTPMQLQAVDLKAAIIPTGKKVSGLIVRHKNELQKLHETVMKKMWKYLSYDVEISMLFSPPEIEEVTLYWIRNYARCHGDPSLFEPHITVGFGETGKFKFPVDFSASVIALCRLGNYCTCRQIITASELTG